MKTPLLFLLLEDRARQHRTYCRRLKFPLRYSLGKIRRLQPNVDKHRFTTLTLTYCSFFL